MSGKSSKLTNQLQEMDQLIRAGSQGEARKILLDLNFKRIPRPQATAVCDLARRLNVPQMMISVLKPYVRPEFKNLEPASNRELALYGTALSRLGVFAEAQKIFDSCMDSSSPDILLFRAQHEMLQWDYQSPIKKLENYILSPAISDYERMVGQVNLAASHVWNMNWKGGASVIEKIQSEILHKQDSENYRLILGYTYELQAEMAILSQDLESAGTLSDKALEILSGSRSRYEFFAKKWKAILNLIRNPKSSENLSQVHCIRQEAVQLLDWETFRDCEFYESLALRDDSLFIKVYNGTPYVSFRKRIQKIYQPTFSIPPTTLWIPGKAETLSRFNFDKEMPVFNLKLGQLEGSSSSIHSHPLIAQLLHLLCKDFFRPISLGSLISQLYPNEYFNPETSPKKAYQAVVRLREWFSQQKLPVTVRAENESYMLETSSPFCFLVSRLAESVQIPNQGSKQIADLARLRKLTGKNTFSTADVADLLQISKRSALRLIDAGISQGLITSRADGRARVYHFAKKNRARK